MTQNSSETQPRIFVLMAATVSGLILMQLLGKSADVVAPHSTPGAVRGDVSLNDSTLPDVIGPWQKQSFQPAPPVNTLPEHQYWWTHAWHFTDGRLLAIVSFDQAGWSGWHELTVCYQGNGWELVSRDISTPKSESSDSWPSVTATFRRGINEHGLLVFSEFHEDGSATPPRQFDVGVALQQELGLGQRFGNRVDYKAAAPVVAHERVLQCQVFVAFQGTPDPEFQQQAQELHIVSRQHFRNAWLASRQTISEASVPQHMFQPR